MTLWDRIEDTLGHQRLDAHLFEVCAGALLGSVYPGLTLISGGTDFGRDADVGGPGDEPMHLLATTDQQVGRNLARGMRRMRQEGVSGRRLVLATSQSLDARARRRLQDQVAKAGFRLQDGDIHDQGSFTMRLYHDPEWRQRLLGIGGDLDGLVARPTSVTSSPGGALPLLGREQELAAMHAAASDLLVIAEPGIGKSRLVAELDGVQFDEATSTPTLLDAVRAASPAFVAVDDASLDLDHLRVLRQLRAQEPRLSFRIVAITWPGEESIVAAELPGAVPIRPRRLLPTDIDETLLALGVGSPTLRADILDQAEGRVGWAIALGSMALAGRVPDLVSGRGLIGEIEPYLRRLGHDPDLLFAPLAAIAALGGIADSDLGRLAIVVGTGSNDLRRALESAATGGLIERDGGITTVGPAALRRALLAREYFERPIPSSIEGLLEAFPERRDHVILLLTGVAGVNGARAKLNRLVRQGSASGLWLAAYAHGDAAAAHWAVVDADLSSISAPDRDEVVRNAALRHFDPAAIGILMDAAVGDDRRIGSDLNHPIRVLTDRATSFHPEFGTHFEARERILDAASRWLGDAPTDEQALAWARLARGLLAPMASGAWSSPADELQGTFYTVVLGPEELDLVGSRIWGGVSERLLALPDSAVAEIVEILPEWLRVRPGATGPGGQQVTRGQARSARRVATTMANDLLARAGSSVGLSAAIRRANRFRPLRLRIPIPPDVALLTKGPPPDRAKFDRHRNALLRLGRRWSTDNPADRVARLREIAEASSLAHVNIGFELTTAFAGLADRDIDALAWADEIVRASLGAQAWQVLARALRERPDELGWFAAGLAGSDRPAVIGLGLANGAPVAAREMTLEALGSGDAKTIGLALMGGSVAEEAARALLRHADPLVRTASPLWFQIPGLDHGQPIPSGAEADWRAAFIAVPSELPQDHQYQLSRALRALVGTDPELVATWVEARLASGESGLWFNLLPYHDQRLLFELPRAVRRRLIVAQGEAGRGRIALRYLLGVDADLARDLIAAGVVTPRDLLIVIRDADDEPDSEGEGRRTFETFAPILLDLGVAVTEVLSLAEPTFGSGEDSDRAEEMRAYFERLADRGDPTLRDLAAAGVRHYRKVRDAHLADEYERKARRRPR